jgi:hypothetical protein
MANNQDNEISAQDDPGLAALVSIARFHGIAADAAQLKHQAAASAGRFTDKGPVLWDSRRVTSLCDSRRLAPRRRVNSSGPYIGSGTKCVLSRLHFAATVRATIKFGLTERKKIGLTDLSYSEQVLRQPRGYFANLLTSEFTLSWTLLGATAKASPEH